MKSQYKILQQQLPEFETSQQARERKAALVNDLKAGSQPTRSGGRRLEKCCKNAACDSPICPRCVRNLRRSFVTGAMACIDQVNAADSIPKDQIVAFSAVLTDMLTEERYVDGDLHKADPQRVNERVLRRHQRAGLPLVFAGVDNSYNEHSENRWDPHWPVAGLWRVSGYRHCRSQKAARKAISGERYNASAIEGQAM